MCSSSSWLHGLLVGLLVSIPRRCEPARGRSAAVVLGLCCVPSAAPAQLPAQHSAPTDWSIGLASWGTTTTRKTNTREHSNRRVHTEATEHSNRREHQGRRSPEVPSTTSLREDCSISSAWSSFEAFLEGTDRPSTMADSTDGRHSASTTSRAL